MHQFVLYCTIFHCMRSPNIFNLLSHMAESVLLSRILPLRKWCMWTPALSYLVTQANYILPTEPNVVEFRKTKRPWYVFRSLGTKIRGSMEIKHGEVSVKSLWLLSLFVFYPATSWCLVIEDKIKQAEERLSNLLFSNAHHAEPPCITLRHKVNTITVENKLTATVSLEEQTNQNWGWIACENKHQWDADIALLCLLICR